MASDHEALIDAIPDLIGVLRDGRLIWVNLTAARYLGLNAGDQGTGVDFRTLVHPEDLGDLQALMAEVLDSGPAPPPMTVRHVRLDGAVRRIEITATRVQWGGLQSVLGMARDVTDRREADESTQWAELAGRVAHAVNNPLAYTSIYLRMIGRKLGALRHDLDDRVERDRILDELEGLVHDASQGVTRIGAAVAALREGRGEPPPADLAIAIDDAIRRFRDPRVKVRRDIEPPPPVAAEQTRLQELVGRLLACAAGALPAAAGPTELTVVTRARNGRIVLEVRVPVADAAVDQAAWATCARSAEGMHGLAAVEPAAGGLTLRVDLTAARPPRSPPSNDPIRVAMRVLVIDDDEALVHALEQALRGDAEVVGTTRGRDGIDLACREEFDVVLCDVRLPDISGADVFHALHAVRPALARRVVLMSGGADRLRAQAPAARWLDKPFHLEDLRTLLEEVARGSG